MLLRIIKLSCTNITNSYNVINNDWFYCVGIRKIRYVSSIIAGMSAYFPQWSLKKRSNALLTTDNLGTISQKPSNVNISRFSFKKPHVFFDWCFLDKIFYSESLQNLIKDEMNRNSERRQKCDIKVSLGFACTQ